MTRKTTQKLTIKEIEKLLNQQTVVILNAVDQKILRLEIKMNQNFDRLTTTLDKFLKRVRATLREKLGVILD